jgi:hypothetical protein
MQHRSGTRGCRWAHASPDDPAGKNIEPNAGVAVLSSTKKSKHEGDIEVVDISAKGKGNSSNTTWREMIILFDWKSRHL